jgi:magnesium transporter
LYGIVLCVAGALLIGATGPDVSASEANLDAATVSALLVRPPFVLFIVLTLCAAGALVALSHFTTLGHRYIFVYIGVSSLLGGVTVVCAKALSTFLRLTVQGHSQFGNWLPVALASALILAIVAQLRYLNLAMARFGNSQVVPVYYVLFTICAMSSGVIMYKEFDSLRLQNVPFFFGIAATMSGVFLVARESTAEDTGYIKAPEHPLIPADIDLSWNQVSSEDGRPSRPRDGW